MNVIAQLVAELAKVAAAGDLVLSRVVAEAQANTIAPAALLDALSTHIAVQYHRKEFSYEFGDRVMNAVWSMVCSKEFLALNDRTIPEVTQQVFLAFDEGEYVHSRDPAAVDPVEKYTDPLIRAFVATLRTNDD